MELVPLGRIARQLVRLLLEQLQRVGLGDGLALLRLDAVLAPLPQLAAGDLGRRGVFHEVVDGHAADAAEPAFHVTEADVEVLADAFLRHAAGHVHVQEVVGGDVHFFAADVHLVRRGHVLVEDFGGDGGEDRVRNPGAVVASADFAELVLSHVVHGGVVGFLVVLDGDLSGHAAHGVHAATMACLDEKTDIGVHEGHGHGDARSIWEDEVGILAELLDDAEDVVPSAAVETCAVIPEFVDDFVHLESCCDGLDQDCASDGAPAHANVVLGQIEDVVPQSGFQMRLHLR